MRKELVKEKSEALYGKLKKLTRFVWKEKIVKSDIDAWLSNYTGEFNRKDIEEMYALHLLGNFMYFSQDETRELLKSLFEDVYKYPYLREIRKNNADTLNPDIINVEFNEVLKKTKFIGVGNPSESGSLLLYYFRQVNKLSTKCFMNAHQIVRRRNGKPVDLRYGNLIDKYIFLDDLCGTGKQACEYSEEIVEEIRAIKPDADVRYYSLFATHEGMKHVRKNASFSQVDCVFELDDTFKVFSENTRSYIDDDVLSKEEAKKIFEGYGKKILPNHPLGYEDSQLLLGFFYNTPDNTLPVIWFDGADQGNWRPVFERFGKII